MASAAKRRGKASESGQPPDSGKENAISDRRIVWSTSKGAILAAVLLVPAVAIGLYLGGNGDSVERRRPKDLELAPGTGAAVWARAGDTFREGPLLANITCASRHLEGACGAPRMRNECARLVVDNAVPEADAREVRNMVEWLIEESWGAGSGPPSVIDLHQGSISYKDQFIELAALMEFKSIAFTEAQKAGYQRVRDAVRNIVASQFGIPPDDLLHDLAFFSHINGSKTAQNIHDEYWHLHTDTEQYGTFEYTTLLYLSTLREDFTGGEFVFEPSADGQTERPVAVEPRFNRLLVFTSDAENPHRVERVSTGIRIALTAAFTCNKDKAEQIGPAFPPKRPEVSA